MDIYTYDKTGLTSLAEKHGTGQYIFWEERFRKNIDDIRAAFSGWVADFKLAYSIKANYFSDIITIANNQGLYFDCASGMEADNLLQLGVDPKKMWVNTPYLDQVLLEKSVARGICIHVDNIDQLEDIEREAARQNKNVVIGLRLHAGSAGDSRFGMEAMEHTIRPVLKKLEANGKLRLKTLHTHFSGARDAMSFAQRADHLYHVYERWFSKTGVAELNIGGGITGPMDETLARQFEIPPCGWNDYREVLKPFLLKINKAGLALAIEPGMALVADSFTFLAEVVCIKDTYASKFALLNTSNIFLKPTGHRRALSFEVIHRGSNDGVHTYQLAGMTCMENDLPGTYTGCLQKGDLIHFKNVGAYTHSFRPDFIFPSPQILTLKPDYASGSTASG